MENASVVAGPATLDREGPWDTIAPVLGTE